MTLPRATQTEPPSSPRRRSGVVLRGAMLVLAGLMALVAWFGGLNASGNFHAVVPGEVYRSGQLGPEDLRRRIKADGIRTVVNLRGAQPDRSWYRAELAAAQAEGAAHFDFRMSAAEPLDADRAAALVTLMRTAQKPLLIHCEGGADRTGLAAALYLAAIAGTPLDDAAGQLSARFGHVGLNGITRAWPMTESWNRLSGGMKAAEDRIRP